MQCKMESAVKFKEAFFKIRNKLLPSVSVLKSCYEADTDLAVQYTGRGLPDLTQQLE